MPRPSYLSAKWKAGGMPERTGPGYFLVLTEEDGELTFSVTHYEYAFRGYTEAHPMAMVAQNGQGLFIFSVANTVLADEGQTELVQYHAQSWELELTPTSENDPDDDDDEPELDRFFDPTRFAEILTTTITPAVGWEPFESVEEMQDFLRRYLEHKQWVNPIRIDEIIQHTGDLIKRTHYEVLRPN